MIYILHHNRYWTEYLDFLLSDTKNFSLIASKEATEDYKEHKLQDMIPFCPKKHEILLTPGRLHEPTDHNKIIMRFLHSPGFFIYPIIKGYADLLVNRKDSDYRFLILEQTYRIIAMREIADPAIDRFRYLMMNDPKVRRMEADPNLFSIKEAPRKKERILGTGLLAFTWLLMDNDFNNFLEVCKKLKKELKLTILLHPLMRLDPDILERIRSMEGELFEKVYYNLTREELIDMFDAHEFVISDGSGSCYEAIIRECKPLTVKGMRSVPSIETFNDDLEEEYFPFPEYHEIGSYSYDSEAFLKEYFSYLYTGNRKEVEKSGRNEILSLDFLI